MSDSFYLIVGTPLLYLSLVELLRLSPSCRIPSIRKIQTNFTLILTDSFY